MSGLVHLCLAREDAPGGGELKVELHHGEEVDVAVVDGEVEGEVAGAAVQPQVALQLRQHRLRHVLLEVEVLHVARAAVGRHLKHNIVKV